MNHKRKILLSIAILIVVFFATVWIVGGSLVSPVNQPIGAPTSDISAQTVQFQSLSGTTIHGWFLQGKERTGAIVLMHGVRANRLAMLDRARFLNRKGFSVLLFDFQAHGESIGKNITFGYLESKDAQAAVDYVHSLLPNEKIGVIGSSMGGAAFLLAKPKLQVNAVILEMVYPTIEKAVSNRITLQLGNWSAIFTPLLTYQLEPRLGISVKDLHPIDNVGSINIPKLFIIGEKDKHTTLEDSNALFAAASEPKELWVVPNAEHQDFYSLLKEEYAQKVSTFFETYLQEQNN